MDTMSDFDLEFVDPATGHRTVIGNVTNVGGALPGTLAYVPSLPAAQFLTIDPSGETSIVTINSSNDHVIQNLKSSLVVSNLAYDFNLKSTVVEAHVSSNGTDAVYSMAANSSTLQPLLTLEKVKIEVCISTYCPVGHIFFLLQMTNGINDKMLRVDVVNKKVLSEVQLQEAVEVLMWDYQHAVMYAWVATSVYAAELISLNITSGSRIKSFASFKTLSANGGASTMDMVSGKVYASLLGGSGFADPFYVTVDLTSQNVTQTPAGIFHIGMAYLPPSEVARVEHAWKL